MPIGLAFGAVRTPSLAPDQIQMVDGGIVRMRHDLTRLLIEHECDRQEYKCRIGVKVDRWSVEEQENTTC